MADTVYYRQVLNDTLTDVARSNDSIFADAEEKMKSFLDTNTKISDNEKAKIYANFLSTLVTAATQQAIGAATQMASQVPLAESEIDVNVSKKALIEQQKLSEVENTTLVHNQAQHEVSKQALTDAQKDLTDQQVLVEQKRVELMQQQINLEQIKMLLTQEQINLAVAEALYRQEQAMAVRESLIVNKEIEAAKDATAIRVATIQASGV